jgi:hypothetical protein
MVMMLLPLLLLALSIKKFLRFIAGFLLLDEALLGFCSPDYADFFTLSSKRHLLYRPLTALSGAARRAASEVG